MTVGTLLSHMGIGSKGLTERLSHADYGGAVHDPHMIYSYEHPTHGNHVASSKHHHVSSGHKNNTAAMSALTLLAFLFFLHILQQCLKEHMTAMRTPPVVVMTGGREGEQPLGKTAENKNDKYGATDEDNQNRESYNANNHNNNEKQSLNQDDAEFLTKIHTEVHTPIATHRYKSSFGKNYENRTLSFPGFVSAMEDPDWN